MHRHRRVLAAGVVAILVPLLGCDSDPTGLGKGLDFITSLTITPNPVGYSPLTAEVSLTTTRPVQIELVIPGRNGATSETRQLFDITGAQARFPILGLYANATNTITLRFLDGNTLLGETSRDIETQPLLVDLPEVTIDAATPGAMKPGMNLVSYFGYAGEFAPQRPFIFDATGAIRWYLDFSNHPTLNNLFYDDGVERLSNGNLYFGDGNSGRIIEMDMLGRIVRTWTMPGYHFHHQVLEKPDGNFLVTVNKDGAATVEDHIIEIDRETGVVVREWDLNQSLDNTRRAWATPLANLNVDWFHANGLVYDPSDDAIIVSGRTQGTVKLTNNNEVVWIIAPHVDWGTAGDGGDLLSRLLQPIDANGQAITDQNVLDGTANHPDFEWAWYQHAPELLPDGSLMLFDNGDNRNYQGVPSYSRAVVYHIDPAAMTIQQIWEYGKERGSETFSRIVSDVDYHAAEDNVMFMPGAVVLGEQAYGKVIEVDRDSRNVVFEATIRAPIAPFGITFHRVERLSLYGSN